jgi:hypothetical protein
MQKNFHEPLFSPARNAVGIGLFFENLLVRQMDMSKMPENARECPI